MQPRTGHKSHPNLAKPGSQRFAWYNYFTVCVVDEHMSPAGLMREDGSGVSSSLNPSLQLQMEFNNFSFKALEK